MGLRLAILGHEMRLHCYDKAAGLVTVKVSIALRAVWKVAVNELTYSWQRCY